MRGDIRNDDIAYLVYEESGDHYASDTLLYAGTLRGVAERYLREGSPYRYRRLETWCNGGRIYSEEVLARQIT